MQTITRSEALSRLTSENNLLNKIGQSVVIPESSHDGEVALVEIEDDPTASDQPEAEASSLAFVSKAEASCSPANLDSADSHSARVENGAAELLASVLSIVDENGNLPKKTVGQRGRAMPQILRELVGIEGHLTKPGSVAQEYGISPAQVSEYKRGHVGGKPKPEMQANLEQELGKVRGLAIRKLTMAMKQINNTRLGEMDASQLSTIARNMSAVMANTIPNHRKNFGLDGEEKPQFVLVVPQVQQESSYRQIEVGG